MKKITPFFIILILLTACNEELKPVEFETKHLETNYDANITVSIDEAKQNNNLSKTINQNIEKAILSTVNSTTNESKLETVLEHFNDEYLKFKSEYPEVSEPIWELSIETELSYQSSEVLTIAIGTYEFKGGAHGNDQIKLLNLNAQTGEVLDTASIINNIEDFTKFAESQFIKSLEKDKNNSTIDNFFFGEPFQLPENIGFSEEGLILIYNVYEVASYDLGYTEFMIPFEEVRPFLKLQ